MPHLAEIIAPPIPTNGHEDTYDNFGEIYPPELLQSLSALVLTAAQEAAPDIEPSDIWVSGFSGGLSETELEATDTAKLKRRAASFDPDSLEYPETWSFEGDDSNERNVVQREITLLKQDVLDIGREMSRLNDANRLTHSALSEMRGRISEINAKIAELKTLREQNKLPVYYATTLDGVTNPNQEDNPLAYIGDVPGEGSLVVYNGRTAKADEALRVSNKSDDQIRIAGRGRDIMRHALAVVRLVYTDEEQ